MKLRGLHKETESHRKLSHLSLVQHDCTLGVVVCQRSQQLCGSGPPLRPNDNNRRPGTNKKAVDVTIVFS